MSKENRKRIVKHSMLKHLKKLNLMTPKTSQIAKNDLTIDKHIISIRKAAEELKSNISLFFPIHGMANYETIPMIFRTVQSEF